MAKAEPRRSREAGARNDSTTQRKRGWAANQYVSYTRLTVNRLGVKIGHEVQLTAIAAWEKANNVQIVRHYWDDDVSADDRKGPRPHYERMLADIQAGTQPPNVVVSAVDRLQRRNKEWARFAGILEDMRGHLRVVTPDSDSRTPSGRQALQMMVMMAEGELEVMKARALAHQQHKARLGRYGGGGPRPYGFEGPKRDHALCEECRSDGMCGTILNSGRIGVAHVPDEVKLLKEAAQRIAWGGEDWVTVCNDWNARGLRGSTGKPWSVWVLQRILTGPRIIGKRVYSWEDPDTGERVHGETDAEWKPILDLKTWNRLKATLQPTGKRGPKERYLLSGLITCDRCGHKLTGCRRTYERDGEMWSVPTYRCKSGPEHKTAGACGRLSVLAEEVEEHLIGLILVQIEGLPELMALVLGDSGADKAMEEALADIDDCNAELRDISLWKARRELEEQEWQVQRKVLLDRRDAAQRIVDQLSAQTRFPVPESRDFDDLWSWFDELPLSQQRAFVRAFLVKCSISPAGAGGPRFDAGRIHPTLVTLPPKAQKPRGKGRNRRV